MRCVRVASRHITHRRLYSPPRHLAANTPKPSHKPYLHPCRSLEAECPAIFYTRQHILHCDVKRSASSRKAQAIPASAVSVLNRLVGTLLRRWDVVSCIFGSAKRRVDPATWERARWWRRWDEDSQVCTKKRGKNRVFIWEIAWQYDKENWEVQ